jgi:hypothetical protein
MCVCVFVSVNMRQPSWHEQPGTVCASLPWRDLPGGSPDSHFYYISLSESGTLPTRSVEAYVQNKEMLGKHQTCVENVNSDNCCGPRDLITFERLRAQLKCGLLCVKNFPCLRYECITLCACMLTECFTKSHIAHCRSTYRFSKCM